MEKFKDWFYKQEEDDVLVVQGFFPALFKVDARELKWYVGALPHKYYHGNGIELICDDVPDREGGFRKLSLDKFGLKEGQEVKAFTGWYKEGLLYRPKTEMFYEGVLEFAEEHFSKL